MFKNNNRILFISAHLDDVELGCGATISKLVRNGSNVYVMGVCKNRRDSDGNIQEQRDVHEFYAAMKILGVKTENIIIPEKEIAGQLFPEYRQKLLEILYSTDRKINPDVVCVTSGNDVHQDHRTLFYSCVKAFKRRNLLCYEVINSADKFKPNLYFEVTETDIHNKIKAIQCYKTQMTPGITTNDYFSKKIIEGNARICGVKAGFEFAESYEICNFYLK